MTPMFKRALSFPVPAVDSAKNLAAGPGLPNPSDDVSRRNTMVGAPAELADTIAEAARELADALRPDRRGLSLRYAGDGYALCGELKQASASLDTVCKRLACWAHEVAEDPTLRHDTGGDDAVEYVRRAAHAVQSAHLSLASVYAALDTAQQWLGPIGHITVTDETEGGER